MPQHCRWSVLEWLHDGDGDRSLGRRGRDRPRRRRRVPRAGRGLRAAGVARPTGASCGSPRSGRSATSSPTSSAAAHWSDADLRDVEETIGGEGTPMVAAGCVEAFATALGVGTRTAHAAAQRRPRPLLPAAPPVGADGRAPGGSVASPPDRRRHPRLSPQAAAYVEAKLVKIADSCGPVKLDRLVTEARGDVRPGRAGRGRGPGQGRLGGAPGRLPGPDLGRHLAHGDHRRHARPCTTSWTCLSTGAHDQLDPSRPADEQAEPGPSPGRGAQLPDQRDDHGSADQGLRAPRPRRPPGQARRSAQSSKSAR